MPLNTFLVTVQDRQAVPPLLDLRTQREVEVLRLLADGTPNAAIAAALVVSVGTVKKHVYYMCRKLACRTARRQSPAPGRCTSCSPPASASGDSAFVAICAR